MASVVRRTDGRPGYIVRWRDETGRQRKKSFKRSTDAGRFKAQIEHQLLASIYVDPSRGREPFEDYAERWRAKQPHQPSTANNTRSRLTKHIYPAFKGLSLAGVRFSDVQALVSGLDLSPGSVRNVHLILSAIFASALRDRAITDDPTVGVKLPEYHRSEVQPLTVDQVEAIAIALPQRYRAIAWVAAGTGLRQGEIFGLQVRDVNFLKKSLRVERQVQPYGVGRLKNRRAYRSIPVGDVVINALAAHLAEFPAGPEDFIFRTEDGQPLQRGTMYRPWDRARRSAGLPDVGMHDFRHFYASVLIAAGRPVREVSDRLGHSNAAMTLNVYSHLWPESQDKTRQAVDDAFKIDPETDTRSA